MIEASMLNNQANYSHSAGEPAIQTALRMYRTARVQAWLGQVWAMLTGRSDRLLHLGAVQASRCHYAGTRAVPIRQIRGSEGRCEDFDAGLRPTQAHSQSRWLSVATARLKKVTLPPVELVQVGDIYFIRDGHHRISVASALGEEHIDAEVTVWDAAGPLPGERPVQRTGRLVTQPR